MNAPFWVVLIGLQQLFDWPTHGEKVQYIIYQNVNISDINKHCTFGVYFFWNKRPLLFKIKIFFKGSIRRFSGNQSMWGVNQYVSLITFSYEKCYSALSAFLEIHSTFTDGSRCWGTESAMYQVNLGKETWALELWMRRWRSKIEAFIARQNILVSSVAVRICDGWLKEHVVNFDLPQPAPQPWPRKAADCETFLSK